MNSTTSPISQQTFEHFRDHQDRTSFDLIYRAYVPDLYRFLVFRIHDEHMAKDVVQQTFLKYHEQPQHYDITRNFAPWLFATAMNCWKNMLRKQKNQERIAIAQPTPIAHVEQESSTANQWERTLSAMNQLQATQKEIILLKYVNNFTINEISEILSISTGTVKSRLFYALEKMRELTLNHDTKS